MGIQIHILLNLQRHKGINISWKEDQPVIRTKQGPACELVCRTSAQEPEILEYLERRIRRQAVDIHNTSLFNHMMGIVIFINGYGNPVRCIRHLCHRIDNQSIVLLSVVGRHDIKPVTDLKQCGQIILIGCLVMLRQIILTELVSQRFKLCVALLVKGGMNTDGGICKGELLASF